MSDPLTRTTIKRIELYRDRWTSYGSATGLKSISDKPSAAELKEFEIFRDYDEAFLERLSQDISIAVWKPGSVLFEEGTYLDLAFFVAEGEVEVSLQGSKFDPTESQPIFDISRTMADSTVLGLPGLPGSSAASGSSGRSEGGVAAKSVRTGAHHPHEITFLATMDFDLVKGSGTRLGPGEIFGEIGALSGWPQSVTARTATECRVVQIRVPALRRMKRKSDALKKRLDDLYRERSLFTQLKSTPLFAGCTDLFLGALKQIVELVSCSPDEVVVREGEKADSIYLVRSGFVRLVQRFGEGEIAVSYLSKGMTLGEVELLVDGVDLWESTAASVEYSELVKIPREAFENILRTNPEVEKILWRSAIARIKEAGSSRRNIDQAEFTQVALDTGLVQGSSMLVIDLEQCTRCDDCVRACAATHEGRPRFVREGSKIENLLVAKSCYHCRDPVCLVGCPTGAIHRAGIGDVVAIDEDICIGCATCARGCPYDAIVMHDTGEVWPEDMIPEGLRGQRRSLASKCDLCHSTGHEPACVTNCPQGCAHRVGSLLELQNLFSKGS